jgi:hypothetical protein
LKTVFWPELSNSTSKNKNINLKGLPNKTFLSDKYGKNMKISSFQNLFCPIFKVIYHKYIHILGRICAFLGNFMYFWGILEDFQAEIFRGFID